MPRHANNMIQLARKLLKLSDKALSKPRVPFKTKHADPP